MAKEGYAATREMMKQHTLEAQRKWRTLYTNIPQIYPSEKDWAGVTPINRTFEFLQVIIQVTSLEVVKGIYNTGEVKIRYFVDKTEHKKLMKKLEQERREFPIEPFFPLPRGGILQKQMKEGMTWLESQQVTALYHIELKAVLKEIFTHSFNKISSRTFTRVQHTIWNLAMPFWKEEIANEMEEEPNKRLILRDLPSHISTRRRWATFQLTDPANVQSNYEESRTYQPLDFTTDFTNHDPQNIHAWQVEQYVGTQWPIQEKLFSIRQGCLRELITGPQYFHTGNESYERPDIWNWSINRPKPEDPSIYLDELPSTQSSSSQDEWDTYQGGPPGRDPDDPDDFGPPGGGFPNWWPRYPGLPSTGPPVGPLPQNIGNQGNQDDRFRFNLKMKPKDMPTWDSNGDLILEWLNKINHLAYQNLWVFNQLGVIVPLCLMEHVMLWFYTLPDIIQWQIQQNWGTFKLTISSHFMNQQWFDRMKGWILCMRYLLVWVEKQRVGLGVGNRSKGLNREVGRVNSAPSSLCLGHSCVHGFPVVTLVWYYDNLWNLTKVPEFVGAFQPDSFLTRTAHGSFWETTLETLVRAIEGAPMGSNSIVVLMLWQFKLMQEVRPLIVVLHLECCFF